jgi:hypothetical protein
MISLNYIPSLRKGKRMSAVDHAGQLNQSKRVYQREKADINSIIGSGQGKDGISYVGHLH